MAKPPSYGFRWPTYAVLWDRCGVRSARVNEVTNVCKNHLLPNKARYQAIEKKTGVPWWVIAALHWRESDANFNTQLAQGDPLHRRSRNEPISGPFNTFEDSAVWALHHDRLDAQIDWTIEKALYWSEAWNGWGYYLFHPQTPSPYLWGASTVQKPGKFVRDHVWSSTEMDSQLGVAVIFKTLADLDRSIKFVRETPELGVVPVSTQVQAPLPVNKPVVPQKQITATLPGTQDELEKQVGEQPGRLARFWAWLNKTRD